MGYMHYLSSSRAHHTETKTSSSDKVKQADMGGHRPLQLEHARGAQQRPGPERDNAAAAFSAFERQCDDIRGTAPRNEGPELAARRTAEHSGLSL